jgi:hypothetical protein
MTREQKAAAAIGSVLAVSILYMVAWSVWLGLGLLVIGLTACVVALRLTHPRGKRQPVRGRPSHPTARPLPDGDHERAAREAEIARRRAVAQQRALERERARGEAANAEREADDEDRHVMAASQRAELPADGRGQLDQGRQRHQLLDEVRTRLTDYS